MINLKISNIPIAIFYIIKEYINHEDYRNLVNVNNSDYFGELKKTTVYYSLKEFWSNEFYLNPSFRARVLSLIDNPSKQLGIFFGFKSDKVDIIPIQPAHALKMIANDMLNYHPEIQDLSLFTEMKVLSLQRSTYITSCNGLRSTKTLLLSCCVALNDLSYLAKLSDLQCVELVLCDRVNDVNCLKNVSKISIYRCPITDEGIKELGQRNEKIAFQECSEITSVNHLKSLKLLSLILCPKIISISELFELKTLHLTNCAKFRNYSNLPNLKKFSIVFCEQWDRDIPINSSFYLEELSFVPTLLTFPNLPLQSLQYLQNLQLVNCSELIELNCLSIISSLRSLTISNCKNCWIEFERFQQLEYLKLVSCDFCERINQPLMNLKTLIIDSCAKFQSLHGFYSYSHPVQRMKVKIDGYQPCFENNYAFFSWISSDQIDKLYLSLTKFYEDLNNDVENPIVMESSLSSSVVEANNPASPRPREKYLRIDSDMKFPVSILPRLFSSLHLLYLSRIDELTSLDPYYPGGISIIPILIIRECYYLKSLYSHLQHRHFDDENTNDLPFPIEHDHLVLDCCSSLSDITCLRAGKIRMISIQECHKIKDIRFFRSSSCQRIQMDGSLLNPQGWDELTHKIFPFRYPAEAKSLYFF